MVAEPGLTLTIYSAEPGSPSQERLRLLASGPRPKTPSKAISNSTETS